MRNELLLAGWRMHERRTLRGSLRYVWTGPEGEHTGQMHKYEQCVRRAYAMMAGQRRPKPAMMVHRGRSHTARWVCSEICSAASIASGSYKPRC